ncbi:MAG: kynurenine formamidase [Gammaproteobacteria bacterium]|jgi:kynurenine formamidase
MKLPTIILILGLTLSMHAVAEPWYPSKWGKDDTLGAVNEITPAHIVNAAKLVKTGKRYALGMETSRDTPAFGARTAQIFMVSHAALFGNAGEPYGTGKATGNDDWALLFFGVGSQIDGLAHVGIDHVYYNGNKVQDFFHQSGTKKLGTSNIPPIVTRGVVLDIVGYLKEMQPERVMTLEGKEMLKPDVAVNEAELKGAMARQNITLGKGEVIIVHTGYMALIDIDRERYMASQPGLGLNGALFLASHDPVAVGADTFGIEVTPGEVEGLELSVHMALLPKRGIYLLENMVTHELVADEAWEFMFVLGQARIKGTVQMIINPVAIR